MRNPAQLIFNAVLLLAVAGLYVLHFRQPKASVAAAPAATEAPAATAAADTAAAAEPVAAETPEVETPAAAPAAPAAPVPAGAIVYVESSRLLDGYQGMKDARRTFEGKAKGWQSRIRTLETNFRAAVEQYQKTAASLTAEQRAAAEQKLQEQQQSAGAEQQQIQAQAQEAEAKLTQTVLGGLNKKIEGYGKAHGYKMILIAATGNIAYGDKSLDITTPVLAYLNAEYRKK